MKDLEGLKTIWTSPEAFNYPLTSTTFWIGRRLWGLNPFPYHVLNVILHSVNAILFWALLADLKIPGARFAAALFVLHPVHVESVAWITELKNVQSSLFYLLSIASFDHFYAGRPKKKLIWYGASLLFFSLSLLSKTATVMLPMILLLLMWWRDGIWKKEHVFLTLPFFALSIVAAGWTIWEQLTHAGATGLDWSLSWLERVGVAGKAVWFYLSKIIWPNPLVFVYERWPLNPGRVEFYWGAIGVLLTFLFLYFRRTTKWGKHLLVTWTYFVVSLFPVLGFFNVYFMRFSFVADHFQYIANISPIALVASIVWNSRKQFVIRLIISFLILILLAALTWRRAHVYRNEETMWQDTVKHNPRSWLAHDSLGNIFVQHGNWPRAIAHYQEAVRLKPDFAGVHTNLGMALGQEGRFDEAIDHFLTALRLNPYSAEAHNGFASVLVQMGRTEEAARHYERAIQLKPDYTAPRQNLNLLSLHRGELQ
ncbi:MAG: tetratricopeptide repeat protein [Candidatus Omnitrophica bacterium]|nr:tetratricopeptide repeat protein [Candidatus Omnitrophota bacterium]